MKSDTRWNKSNKRVGRIYRARGVVDARNVLNQKRINKPKPPVLGSYMRTNTAKAAMMPSQIKTEIFSHPKESNKSIKLSSNGNIIITKSRNVPQMAEDNMPQFNFGSFSRNRFQEMAENDVPKFNFDIFPRNRLQEEKNAFQSSSSMDDLEQTSIEDVLDFDSLPQSYVNSKSLHTANLSRNSAINRMLNTEHFSRNPTVSQRLDFHSQNISHNPTTRRRLDTENVSHSAPVNRILNRKHTMVADQFSQYHSPSNKVHVSDLHPAVSRHDVMELFSDVGIVRSIDMGAPGTAVVEFFSEEDAVKACKVYHNRLLDGLPMKCYLKDDYTPHKFPLSQRLGGRNEVTHNEPIYSDFTPVVFNARSRFNPRNVQFTVQLT